jgi:DNA gyrase subunit A
MAEGEKIIPINIEEEMKTAYIDYSMSVMFPVRFRMCVMA